MLRKACETILEQHRLGKYHARVDSHNKYLLISTECGKPFMTIYGIRFNRDTPTQNEIEYATELLDAALGKHKQDIESYIKLEAKVAKLRVNPKVIQTTSYNPDFSIVNEYPDLTVEFTLDYENYASTSGVKNEKVGNISTIFTIKKSKHLRNTKTFFTDQMHIYRNLPNVPTKDYDNAKKILFIEAEKHRLRKELDNLKSTLSSCNI
jgi:hypothetical protein